MNEPAALETQPIARATPHPALAIALVAALSLPACTGIGFSDSAIAESLLSTVPPELPARAYTLEVTGRNTTLFADSRAVSLLKMAPGVMQVKRGMSGSNHVIVLVEGTISAETLALRLGDEYRVRVVDVVDAHSKAP